MGDYYNGEKLLSKLDINNKVPEIYICDGTRTAGKTFFFKDFLFKKIVNENKKIGVITRHQNTASSIPGAYIKDLAEIKYNGWVSSVSPIGKGKVYKFDFLAPPMVEGSKERDRYQAGYVFPLTSVEFIKINSSYFVDVDWMFMDEFQLLDGAYSNNEVSSLLTIHRSVARGAGKQTRYVPLIMVGNSLDLYNPYYLTMGISQRLQPDTKFLRGDGWVMEHTKNKNAKDAMEKSGVVRALGKGAEDSIFGEVYLNSPALVVAALPPTAVPYMELTDGKINLQLWFSENYQYRSVLYVTTKEKNYTTKLGLVSTTMDGMGQEGAVMKTFHMSRFIVGFVRGGNIRFVGGKAKNLFMDILKTL